MAGRILTRFLHALGLLIFYLGAASLIRRLGRNNPKILLYHDCAERETSFTASLDCTTDPQVFASHLDYLMRHYRVVPLADIVSATAGEGAVAITFDDGYRSVFEGAFPELKRRSFPATVYLISDVVENEELVWVNELNHALQTKPAVARTIVARHFRDLEDLGKSNLIIDHCRLNYDPDAMRALLAELRDSFNYSSQELAAGARLYLGWDEIRTMQKAQITFGNHTRSHPNLERLDAEQQKREIAGAQELLSTQIDLLPSLAYPFGHHSEESAIIAAAVGLRSVVEVGGYNRPLDPLAIGRVHLSNQSLAGLFSRMEIVEPLKGFIRSRLERSRQLALPSDEATAGSLSR